MIAVDKIYNRGWYSGTYATIVTFEPGDETLPVGSITGAIHKRSKKTSHIMLVGEPVAVIGFPALEAIVANISKKNFVLIETRGALKKWIQAYVVVIPQPPGYLVEYLRAAEILLFEHPKLDLYKIEHRLGELQINSRRIIMPSNEIGSVDHCLALVKKHPHYVLRMNLDLEGYDVSGGIADSDI